MNRSVHLWRRPLTRIITAVLMAGFAGTVPVAAGSRLGPPGAGVASAASTCALGNGIQHVIEIQFDNFHFTRDNPNVPSDLEQVPNLLNFMKNQGTLLTNHHTPLISHTANDIVTTLTGLYPDQHGIAVANGFRYFTNGGASTEGSAAFGYWTDPVSSSDSNYLMVNAQDQNTPAPWVPYTRARCDVGMVATANTVFENTTSDINTVFGATSPEHAEAVSNPHKAQADFVGIGIHCGSGGGVCSGASNAKPDVLPQEPGGYSGFQALFGAKYVDPVIGAGASGLPDFNGNPIQDPAGNPGFPGFDGMSANNSLSYVAAMQEHGVPITYAYISDAHDNHIPDPARDSFRTSAYGPGQSGYVAALHAYNTAFGQFFASLASHGITAANSLFIFTSDEGDHFAGGAPVPANCDGVTIPCTYPKIGEMNANMAGLLATEEGITTPFSVHSDDAPTVYINGHPGSNFLGATDTTVRNFEHATANLTAPNLITGQTQNLTAAMADPVEEKLLHMVTGDPARTPTFTWFGDPNYFFFAGAPNCANPCVTEPPDFAWNHGDIQPEIVTTWLGLVGPGVQNLGVDPNVWSDHTDVRPTMMQLVGLKDDYAHEGRTLFEVLSDSALPASVASQRSTLTALGQMYKQIDAPLGQLGRDSLRISTFALESTSPNDTVYTQRENQLSAISSDRDALAAQMQALLEGAEFNGQTADPGQAQSLIGRGQALLNRVSGLAPATAQSTANSFTVTFSSAAAGQGRVLFGSGPGCSGLVETATRDQGSGTTQHTVVVTGNDLPGTVGDAGILPGATYWYEVVTESPTGEEVNNNGGNCYRVTIPSSSSS